MDMGSRLAMLVRVVDQGSLVAAARSLGLTTSAVSRGLSELERSLGVSLVLRSTRRLQLTEDGAQVYARAVDIVARMKELEGSVARRTQRVAGTLRVGLPLPLGRHIIWPRIDRFLTTYPDVVLDCRPIQDPRAMQVEDFDVMLTAGDPPPTRLVARHLALGRPGIYASPDYLRRFGEPVDPKELASHRCLVFHGPWMQVPADVWNFRRGSAVCSVTVKPRLVTSDREGLIVAAMAGAGVIRMACFDPALVEGGRLRRVVPDWECTDGFKVYALYRKGATNVPKVRAFLDFVRQAFAEFDPSQMTLLRPDARVGISGRPEEAPQRSTP